MSFTQPPELALDAADFRAAVAETQRHGTEMRLGEASLSDVSADSLEATGAETPADALGVTKRMSSLEAETQEPDDVEQCPECGYTSETWHGIKIHYGCTHDGTLKPALECDWCGETFHVKPKAVGKRRCCSEECLHADMAGMERPPADVLRHLHHEQEMPVVEIAKQFGVVHRTVQKWMDALGVGRRSQSEAERLKWRQMSDEDRRAQIRAAHEATREMAEAGEHPLQTENPERNGYGEGWTEEKRETVRELYDRRCQACGMDETRSKERFGTRLDVHHITPWSYFDDPEERNAVDNLVPLCRSCHRKWEGIPLRPEVVRDE